MSSVSTGIGYTLPFECIAAPDVDPHKLAAQLNGYHLPGVRFQPITFKPLQAGTPAAEIVASWKAGNEAFRKARRKYLLY
jgi:uncharacterized protein YbbC (DUF1343 family)